MGRDGTTSTSSSAALPATETDPFNSLFQVLRGSLTAQVAASTAAESNAEKLAPLNRWPSDTSACADDSKMQDETTIQERCLSTTDAFVGVLAAHYPAVKASLLQSAKSYASSRVQELHRRRRHLRQQRHMRIDRLQQQKRAIEHECAHAVLQVTVTTTQYTQFVSQAYEEAHARLQTLFFECIAEMKKALDRIDGVSCSETTTEDSSNNLTLHDQRARQFAWDRFLLRLREDVADSLCCTQLYPVQVPRSATTDKSDARRGSDAADSLKKSMQNVLLRNGPTLDVGYTLQVQRIVAIGPTTKASEEDRPKGKPSLHFGDSGATLWTDVMRHSRSQTQLASVSSARRVRQLKVPATGFAIGNAEGFSEFRQLGSISSTVQFPRTECDIPLSSSYICWLLHEHENYPGLQNKTTINANVYFDLDEFKSNFENVMATQRSKDSRTDDSFWTTDMPTALVTDNALFASVQRSLQEIKSIIAEIGSDRGDTFPAFVPMHQLIFAWPSTSNSSNNTNSSDEAALPKQEEHKKEALFMRASVLQLLQTVYYATTFLAQLSPSDIVCLEQLCGNVRHFGGSPLMVNLCGSMLIGLVCLPFLLRLFTVLRYPTSLFGAGILSTLYVPYIDADVNPNSPQASAIESEARCGAVTMRPLDPSCIHELLLVYVARSSSRRDTSGSSARGASQQLSSLAVSDAISSLLPRHLENNGQYQAQQMTYQCVVKNPGALWKRSAPSCISNTRQEDDDRASLQQILAAADSVFVEYRVVLQDPKPRTRSVANDQRTRQVAAVFARDCAWRSCLAPPCNESSRQPLCAWHSVLQQFVSEDDAQQYVLSGDEVTTCVSALAHCSSANAAKRLVLHASSLLDELLSRHLNVSIGDFFKHMQGSFSNHSFTKNNATGWKQAQATPQRKPKDTDQGLEVVLADLQASLEEMSQIESVERRTTQDLQRLVQLATYKGVDTSAIHAAVEEVKEFDASVRTKDLQLLFPLSTRKLQLLRRRQETLETRLSVSSMTSDQEQQHTSSPVYDVVHVLRKGRKSLLQQQQQQQNQQRSRHLPPSRPQSTSNLGESDAQRASGLTRSVSDILRHKSRASYQS